MKHRRKGHRTGAWVSRLVLVIVAVAVAGYFGVDLTGEGDGALGTRPAVTGPSTAAGPSGVRGRADSDAAATQRAVTELMRAERSGVMVTLRARVVKVLADDNDGSRHQRLLVGIETPGAPEDTVLIAHNIDLAPRVPVSEGDEVLIRGQYEYNELGGVIHWTHHDPGDRREGGWIEHDGSRYE